MCSSHWRDCQTPVDRWIHQPRAANAQVPQRIWWHLCIDALVYLPLSAGASTGYTLTSQMICAPLLEIGFVLNVNVNWWLLEGTS